MCGFRFSEFFRRLSGGINQHLKSHTSELDALLLYSIPISICFILSVIDIGTILDYMPLNLGTLEFLITIYLPPMIF